MTTATLEKKSTNSAKEQSVKAIDKPDDTFKIIGRLFDYMAGGKDRSRFILALIVRVVALICLTALPWLTGEAVNVISEPGGTIAQLRQWIIEVLLPGWFTW